MPNQFNWPHLWHTIFIFHNICTIYIHWFTCTVHSYNIKNNGHARFWLLLPEMISSGPNVTDFFFFCFWFIIFVTSRYAVQVQYTVAYASGLFYRLFGSVLFPFAMFFFCFHVERDFEKFFLYFFFIIRWIE